MELKTYDAFISYRHVKHDKAIAEKLQKLLETYIPPKSNNYANTNRIRKVFRDESELPTSGDLDKDIKKALDHSAFLIVVCSRETAESQWCQQEIAYFKELHGGNNSHILTLLVDGDPREVFPKELCYENRVIMLPDGKEEVKRVEVEPLAANVTAQNTNESIKRLKTEFLRIAAPILGCGYDDLYRRHQKRLIRNVITVSAVIIALLSSFAAFTYSQFLKINNQALQISSQKNEIENAYGQLEKTNQQLAGTNVELEETNNALNDTNNKLAYANDELADTNKKLSDQVDETNRQKNLAEENRVEAESQAALAKENERKALDNLDLANAQKALAIENRNQAVTNLNMAREQQLFRSVTYARQLAESGDRTQAAAILSESYERFDKSSARYPDFLNQIETAMANTAYFPKYSAYMKLAVNGRAAKAVFSSDDSKVAVAAGESVSVWDVQTGKAIGLFDNKSEITAIAIKDGYLIAGGKGATLRVWDLKDGRLLMERSFSPGNDTVYDKIQGITCNDTIHSIVISEGFSDRKELAALIPYPWLEGSRNSSPRVMRTPNASFSDNGRYMVFTGIYDITALDLNRFDYSVEDSENLSVMTIYQYNTGNGVPLYLQINNQGMIFFQTLEGKNYTNYANIHDANKGVQVKRFEVEGIYRIVFPDKLGDYLIGTGNQKAVILNLKDKNPSENPKTISTSFGKDYCKLDYINEDLFLLSQTLTRDESLVCDMNGETVSQLQSLDNATDLVSVSHDGKKVMTVSNDGGIILHDLNGAYEYAGKVSKYLNSSSRMVKGTFAEPNIWSSDMPEVYSLNADTTVNLSFSEPRFKYFECYGISSDGRLVFGRQDEIRFNEGPFAIWDAATGKIVDLLESFNAIKRSSSVDAYGISPNLKYIITFDGRTAYVYSINRKAVVDSFETDEYYAYTGMDDDGNTVWMLNRNNGHFVLMDLKTRQVLVDKNIHFDGTYITNAVVNVETNRLLITSTDLYGDSSKRETGVYSLATGEKMIPLSKLVSDAFSWVFSDDASCAYVSAYGLGNLFVNIPSFDAILGDIRKMSDGRRLTPEERQLSGLSIFDY